MESQPGNSDSNSNTEDGIAMYKNVMGLLNSPDSRKVLIDVVGKDIIMFIGTTRSGKSTLVNFAIGNKLEAVSIDDDDDDEYIIKNRDEKEGPIIGELSVSETTIPTIWKTKRSNLSGDIVDAPGFDDNRGEVQDIANAFYISEIIRNAKSVKFALVADIHGLIHTDISIFVNLIEKVHTIFPELDLLVGGIALIFTKVEKNTTQQKISRQLKDKILLQDELNISGREWVQYFVDNNTCIGFFKVPTSGGIINEEGIASGILDIIQSKTQPISGEKLSNVKPGIANSSKIFLLRSYDFLRDKDGYSSLLKSIEELVASECRRIHSVNATTEVTKMDGRLLNLQNKVKELASRVLDVVTLSDALDLAKELGITCGLDINTEQQENINIMVQFFDFIERMLQITNTLPMFLTKLESTIKEIMNSIQIARLVAANKLEKISLEELKKQKGELEEQHNQELLKRNEEVRKLQQDNKRILEQQKNNLGFFGTIGSTIDKACSVM